MNSILLAWNRLCSLALLDVEYLHRLIVRCSDQEISGVIEVKGGYVRVDAIRPRGAWKLLQTFQSLSWYWRWALTFAGLYFETTSCTFCCGAMLEAIGFEQY